MSRKTRGINAASWFYGQPGFHASAERSATDRQAIPLIETSFERLASLGARPAFCICAASKVDVACLCGAGVLQPPVEIPPRRDDDAISQAFAATRETIAKLEAALVEPMTDVDWSPAQMCRRAA